MRTQNQTFQLTLTALLIGIGIVIPIISPFKLILEPASFTLASHVATMFAMFLSPSTAFIVAIGTGLGFLLGGFPIVITLRALTHALFATLGAFYLKKYPNTLHSGPSRFFFNFVIGLIHALCEVIVVFAFYFGGDLAQQWQISQIFLLIGLGTVLHSMIDFTLSYWLYQALPNKFLKPYQKTR